MCGSLSVQSVLTLEFWVGVGVGVEQYELGRSSIKWDSTYGNRCIYVGKKVRIETQTNVGEKVRMVTYQ